jgi:hypothetical protein
MEPDYEYAELRVAYPGRPRISLVDGISGANLKRIWGVADQFYDRRERVGERQEQVYRLPVVPKTWEVTERIGERTRYRYVTVIGGSLRRIDYQSVVSVLRGRMSLAEAMRSCRNMDVGPDYDEMGMDEDDDNSIHGSTGIERTLTI